MSGFQCENAITLIIVVGLSLLNHSSASIAWLREYVIIPIGPIYSNDLKMTFSFQYIGEFV